MLSKEHVPLMVILLCAIAVTVSRLMAGQEMDPVLTTDDAPIVIKADRKKHTATVIFLHGLGDSGNGWKPAFKDIKESHIKYVLPNAPPLAVTLNSGFVMPAWYDIKALSEDAPEDIGGINRTANYVGSLVQKEIDDGIPADRIVLGGFSQGGAVALFTGLTMDTPTPLAGIVALSAYLPRRTEFPAALQAVNAKVNVFQGHGDSDNIVTPLWGNQTREYLEQMGVPVEFKTYVGMAHGVNEAELGDMKDWLAERLPAAMHR